MVDKAEKSKVLTCKYLDELSNVARQIIVFSADFKVWIFEGEMGAGKTTLIKSLCKEFGVEDTVQSPTFALVNEYINIKKEVFFHFDFYRIKSQEEALDIGVDDYFYSGNHCFIEWPSKVADLLPEKYIKIKIEVNSENVRVIHLVKYE